MCKIVAFWASREENKEQGGLIDGREAEITSLIPQKLLSMFSDLSTILHAGHIPQ